MSSYFWIIIFETCNKIINNTCDKCHNIKPLLFRIPLCGDHSPKYVEEEETSDEIDSDDMYSIDWLLWSSLFYLLKNIISKEKWIISTFFICTS